MIDCHFLLLLLVDDDTIFVGGTYIDLDASPEALLYERFGLEDIYEDKSFPLQLEDLAIKVVRLRTCWFFFELYLFCFIVLMDL